MSEERRPPWRLFAIGTLWLGWICFVAAIGLIIAWQFGHRIGPDWLMWVLILIGIILRMIGRLYALTRRP
jgi:hypothetical protein